MRHRVNLTGVSDTVPAQFCSIRGDRAAWLCCNAHTLDTAKNTSSSFNHFLMYKDPWIFFVNNQPDALIIQISSIIKLLVSGIFSAHHQEFSTVHSALVSFMQVFDDRFQAESGWNCKQFHPDSVLEL
jgi:hypothetical protein